MEYGIESFAVGQRIQTHPATDLWMAGARYGNVTKVGRGLVRVTLDCGKVVALRPSDIVEIIESRQTNEGSA
jgi:hypothetical protein